MDNVSLLDCSDHEFFSWYLSNTYNKPFFNFLNNIFSGGGSLHRYRDRVTKGVDKSLMGIIDSGKNNGQAFRDNKTTINQNRCEIVQTINLLKTRHRNKNLNKFRDNLRMNCENRDKKDAQKYLSTRLLQSIFTYSGYDCVMETYNIFKIEKDDLTLKILKTRTALLNANS